MTTTHVRLLSDGEERVIEERQWPHDLSDADPRESGFERRSQAMAEGGPADPVRTSARNPRE